MKTKRIELPCFKIVVNLEMDEEGRIDNGSISSDLHETGKGAKTFNAAMDGIESMILAHACAGIDIESPAYIEGIDTAVNACGENF